MGDDRRNDLTERFVFALVQLNQLMYGGRLGDLKNLNLNLFQTHTMIMLKYFGPQRIGAISNYLGCSLSRATNIANNLVHKNYVKRGSDPEDRRVVTCELTNEGQVVMGRFLNLVMDRAFSFGTQWESEHLESVVKTLESLCRTAEEVQGSKRPDKSLDQAV